ncbi:PIN domain-containing protein [uncultured Acetatifactor sp.]|uniref:PIN domain-containing protein n=1 Tax=uncultured Acetatifactor sp. TaxID=1671927 RepID=UPI00261F61D2|nr:PIN domain-containing protein [uncultured Acetatifactor sp.]
MEENLVTQTAIDSAGEASETEENPSEAPTAYDRIYLIDSENISDEWVDLLDTIDQRDAIFVFYTGKSTHINCERVYKLMRHGMGRVQWIRCFEGNNALDFQLVTELGAKISKGEAAEYIIVSRDNGYNCVVRYWKERGIAISKKGTVMAKRTEEPGEAIPAAGPFRGEREAALEEPEKAASDEDFLHALLKSVDIMDNGLLYGALTAFEGMTAGAEEYRRLRDLDEEDKETLRGLLLEDRHERGVNYVRLLAHRNGWAADDAEELYQAILSGPKKNKAKYRKALAERFGKELGERYYLVTKSHYNYVKKI